ncbi:MAG: hypothetical protein MUE94_10520 [Verrucomicrobia bacterium]|jgi:hypothetical protein|nr:hypothetical protein [Verrucomicrobiota bacterium]
MKRAAIIMLLASVIRPWAFENLDFEQTPAPTEAWTDNVPGWRHIGANGGGGSYWNVNRANLSGWAEASLIYQNTPESPWTVWPTPPIDGLFSMAFSAFWPLLPQPTTNDYTSAWIGQTGFIEPGAARLTLITDYTGPQIVYYPENPGEFAVGTLTLYFEGTPVPFTLHDAGTGMIGQPLRELRADLGPFSGQTGELRIGIEGPHTFVIDEIHFVPEPGPASLLVAGLGAFGLLGTWRARRPRSRCAQRRKSAVIRRDWPPR